MLVDFHVKRLAVANRKAIEGVTREAMDRLIKYDYPGNIRELVNIIERAVVISRGPSITVDDLPFAKPAASRAGERGGTLHDALDALECEMVRAALDEAGGNQSRAALSLGIGERTLRYRMKKLRLK
ncbi:MAG: helix-turn-helix domain-containing protein [Deltaproteobacteria bacterium]|nr:helix-turn-helix domain-containing protein [Deltaproteobacteria bacterium]